MLTTTRTAPTMHVPLPLLAMMLLPQSAFTLAASLAHDLGTAWLGGVTMLVTTAGVAWIRWSLKRAVDDRAEKVVKDMLDELGLLPDDQRPRRGRGRRP